MKLVITGGHHSSALPLIDLLKERDLDIDVTWFGHKYSMRGNQNTTLEYRQIKERGIPFIEINAGKFYKTYNPFRLLKIPLGFIQSFYYLLKYKPDVVLSFGGYLAVPVVFSASILGIPSVTHEQTVVTGYANKFISKFANKILISHEESRKFFPEDKVIYSGIPLRKSLFASNSESFVFDNDLPVLYITAGKTGSHKINNLIGSCLKDLLNKFNIIHQCGDHSKYNDYSFLMGLYEEVKEEVSGRYYLRKFVFDEEIGEVFKKSDIFLSRSGAHTTYEIKIFKKPAVLIPIPWTSHNEQYKNAEVLKKQGLGVILKEDHLNCSNLFKALEEAKSISEGLESCESNYNKKALEIILETVRNVQKKDS